MSSLTWFTDLASWMHFSLRGDARRAVVERVAALNAAPWTDESSRRADLLCRRACIEAAAGPNPHPVVGRAVGLLDRAIAGDEPSELEWSDLGAAAGSVFHVSSATATVWAATAAHLWGAKSAAAQAAYCIAPTELAERLLTIVEGEVSAVTRAA